jgi:hypothetical protein
LHGWLRVTRPPINRYAITALPPDPNAGDIPRTCTGRTGGGTNDGSSRVTREDTLGQLGCIRAAPAASVTGQGVFFWGRDLRKSLTMNSSSLTARCSLPPAPAASRVGAVSVPSLLRPANRLFRAGCRESADDGRAPPRLKNLMPAGPPPVVSYVSNATVRVEQVCRYCNQVSIRSSPLPGSVPAGETIPSVTGPDR